MRLVHWPLMGGLLHLVQVLFINFPIFNKYLGNDTGEDDSYYGTVMGNALYRTVTFTMTLSEMWRSFRRIWRAICPLLAVPSVTAHPWTISAPSTALLYNGPLLCGFSVPNKGLKLFTSSNSLHRIIYITTNYLLTSSSWIHYLTIVSHI